MGVDILDVDMVCVEGLSCLGVESVALEAERNGCKSC